MGQGEIEEGPEKAGDQVAQEQRLRAGVWVGGEADDERVDRDAEDGQCQHDGDEERGQSQLSHVDAVDDSEKPVWDGTDCLLEEHELSVAIDPPSGTRRLRHLQGAPSDAGYFTCVEILLLEGLYEMGDAGESESGSDRMSMVDYAFR